MDYYKYLREKKDSTIKSDKIIKNKHKCKESSNICYKCNSISLSSVDGFISCTNCGAINNDIIHYNEDTRFYGINDSKMTADPSRLGLPINPFTPKSSLGTIILGYGNNSFRTLHKWYSTNYKERSLLKAFDVMLNHMKYNNIILPTNVLDKAKDAGNTNIMLCERGNSFGYNNLVVDYRGLAIMRSFGHPVIFDATHSVQLPGGQGGKSGGERHFAPILAKAALSVGIAGIFAETHPDPDNALSDGPNSIPLAKIAEVIAQWQRIDDLAKEKSMQDVELTS